MFFRDFISLLEAKYSSRYSHISKIKKLNKMDWEIIRDSHMWYVLFISVFHLLTT